MIINFEYKSNDKMSSPSPSTSDSNFTLTPTQQYAINEIVNGTDFSTQSKSWFRKSVLLVGPGGTGKSMAKQIAVDTLIAQGIHPVELDTFNSEYQDDPDILLVETVAQLSKHPVGARVLISESATDPLDRDIMGGIRSWDKVSDTQFIAITNTLVLDRLLLRMFDTVIVFCERKT